MFVTEKYIKLKWCKNEKKITQSHSFTLASHNEKKKSAVFLHLLDIIVLSSDTALKVDHKLLVSVLAAAVCHSTSLLVSVCVRQKKQKYCILHHDKKFLVQ